jgi:ferrochelatase
MSATDSAPSRVRPGAPRPRTGALLVNLGSPRAPRTADVRRYLREFLNDPRVIDLPTLPRRLLLETVILPFRPARSAEAYRKIWTEDGSPLLVHGRALTEAVRGRLGTEFPVELGMRYGEPSIADGLTRLLDAGVDRVVVVPLYPQHASSTTGSVLQKTFEKAGSRWIVPDLVTVPAFYAREDFRRAFAAVGRPVLDATRPDLVVMSYHGLPERQIRRGDPSGRCLADEHCCDAIGEANRNCYRAQCVATSRFLAEALGIPPDRTLVTFQSRLGRTPWIRPYTDLTLAELPRRGVKRVAVFSPSFVADCLETLEEIGIRGKDTFLAAGGEAFALVPSLNEHPLWVDAVAAMIREAVAA